MNYIISLSLLLAVAGLSSGAERATSDDVKNLHAMLDPATYNKWIRPNFDSGNPVNVQISAYIIGMHDFDQVSSKIQLDAYFRQSWNDSRLAHSGAGPVIGGQELAQLVWVPDTFFANSLAGSRHDSLVPNVFVRVKPTGEVMLSQRVTEEVMCDSHETLFPMDPLTCSLEIESYGSSAKDITYEWQMSNAFAIDKHFQDPQFKVLGIEQKKESITLSTGTYSRLFARVFLDRKRCSYLVRNFLPLFLLTCLSLASYCLKASTGRRALTLTTSLATLLTYVLMNQSLPVTGSPTAFDFFAIGSIVFSVIALVHEVRQADASYSSSEPQKVRPDGEILGSYVRPTTLRDHAISKAVPIAYLAFIVLYTATCVIIKKVA